MQIGQSIGLAAPQLRSSSGGPPVPAIPQRHVFIVAGQSNAAGRAPNDGGSLFPAGTLEYGAGNTWSPVGNRLYHGPWEAASATSANFGFARQFAIDYQAANPAVTLGFVGVAQGGTGFYYGDWNKGNPSYTQAITRISAALGAAPAGAVLKGILWHQGENDSQDTAAQDAYATALTNFITDFRGDIPGGANLPFVLGGHAQGAQFYNQITHRTIQAIPNTLAYTGYAPADVPQNASLFDSLHYNAISQRNLGSRFVEALVEASANASLGGSGTITTGNLASYILQSGTSGSVTAAALGSPAAGRLVVVGFQGRNSSFSPYPVAASLAGVALRRMASANNGAGNNGTTLMYGIIPTGTTGNLSVTWSGAVNAAQAACFVLPVYDARPHLAGTGSFNMINGSNGYGTSITTSLTVRAGDLIIAMSGAQFTSAPVGTLNLTSSTNFVMGANCTMVVGSGVAPVTATRAVTCSFGTTIVNNPSLTVMALRPA